MVVEMTERMTRNEYIIYRKGGRLDIIVYEFYKEKIEGLNKVPLSFEEFHGFFDVWIFAIQASHYVKDYYDNYYGITILQNPEGKTITIY